MRLRARREERGSVIVEFALVAPLLLMIVMGIIDFGWMIDRNNMVNNVSRDAARVASLDGTFQQVKDTADSELDSAGIDSSDPSVVTVTITCAPQNQGGQACAPNDESSFNTNATSGSTVTVKVVYEHHWITPVGALCKMFGGDSCTGDTITLTRTAEMVRE